MTNASSRAVVAESLEDRIFRRIRELQQADPEGNVAVSLRRDDALFYRVRHRKL